MLRLFGTAALLLIAALPVRAEDRAGAVADPLPWP